MEQKCKCNSCHTWEELRGCRNSTHRGNWAVYEQDVVFNPELAAPEIQPQNMKYYSKACALHNPRQNNLREHVQPLNEQKEFLIQEIPKLVDVPNTVIVFGSLSSDRHMEGVGIRYMNTAGGMQYRLFDLNFSGQEHSAGYFQDKADLVEEAIKRMAYYVRPTRYATSQTHREVLGWYVREDTVVQVPSRNLEEELNNLFGEAETITLSLP